MIARKGVFASIFPVNKLKRYTNEPFCKLMMIPLPAMNDFVYIIRSLKIKTSVDLIDNLKFYADFKSPKGRQGSQDPDRAMSSEEIPSQASEDDDVPSWDNTDRFWNSAQFMDVVKDVLPTQDFSLLPMFEKEGEMIHIKVQVDIHEDCQVNDDLPTLFTLSKPAEVMSSSTTKTGYEDKKDPLMTVFRDQGVLVLTSLRSFCPIDEDGFLVLRTDAVKGRAGVIDKEVFTTCMEAATGYVMYHGYLTLCGRIDGREGAPYHEKLPDKGAIHHKIISLITNKNGEFRTKSKMDQTFAEERKDISRAWTLMIGSPYLYEKPIVLPNGVYKWSTKIKTFEVESNSPSWSQLIYFYHNGFEAVVHYIWPQAQQPFPHVTEGAPLVPALECSNPLREEHQRLMQLATGIRDGAAAVGKRGGESNAAQQASIKKSKKVRS
ncbi:hypothetical protein CEUSTIGMA_g13662.t1 [Chlamydomonas eustigma]|uniref:Uncharacterized protein n=1 Tax=Chlamydomonas eustigma TaxID=1157962 RepID=A0A250XTX3_9CHLO|nr:hypothetical protein CEUSTIGMA_g13662.t1 [Chlamydomonas eustigma]|eukprot:GAX86250.1 hypothetical protein CEUSTIGMA_g13662.t1 [Chlamydomonas eustigma]